jgi:NitT/TauT family transport system permease protein
MMSNPAIAQESSAGLSRARRGRLSWLPRAFGWSRYGHVVISHLLLLVAWQALVVFGKFPAFVLPTPIATAATLGAPSYHWIANTLATAIEVYGGYVIGVGAAVALALLFCWFRTVEKLLMPVLASFNMIPKVALGPLVIVWFKYGIGPNILIAFSICFFPVLLTTVRGLREVDPELLDLIHSLKGSKWQLFTKIQLPSALPYVFSGMKVGAILAVAGAVVGEFLGSDQGLGYLMIQVQVSLDTPAMFMALLLITMVGMSLYGLVLLLERMLVVRDARLS